MRCDNCPTLGRYGRGHGEPRVVVLRCQPQQGRCVTPAAELVKVRTVATNDAGEQVEKVAEVPRCREHARL